MEDILQGLIDIKAVSVNFQEPYIWASGIKAPIYCDNRKTLGHVSLRKSIAQALAKAIEEYFPEAEIIGGTATAGIPHATSVADRLDLPLVYFRAKSKDHGTKGKIEGDYREGQKVVIVEDLISTGGSSIDSVQTAREAGMEVLGVVSIFNYEMQKAVENFQAVDAKWHSLHSFTDLLEKLAVSDAEKDFIRKWQKDPNQEEIWQ